MMGLITALGMALALTTTGQTPAKAPTPGAKTQSSPFATGVPLAPTSAKPATTKPAPKPRTVPAQKPAPLVQLQPKPVKKPEVTPPIITPPAPRPEPAQASNSGSWFPEGFEGGAWGVIASLLITFLMIMTALMVDRRLENWLQTSGTAAQRPRGSRHRVLRILAENTALARVLIWTVALVIALSAAARLSPPTAWMLLPAGGLALALAVANLLRDALVGIGQALTNRVHRGDHVEIGEVAGEVVRVGIRSLRLKTLDGTIIDIPQRRIAADGIHRLSLEGGGHPVTVMLTIPTDLMGTDLLEEARLAALLARHAHLGRKPTASLVDGHPPAIRVVGHAIDPFCADTYSGEVVGCFQEALHAMIKTAT